MLARRSELDAGIGLRSSDCPDKFQVFGTGVVGLEVEGFRMVAGYGVGRLTDASADHDQLWVAAWENRASLSLVYGL